MGPGAAGARRAPGMHEGARRQPRLDAGPGTPPPRPPPALRPSRAPDPGLTRPPRVASGGSAATSARPPFAPSPRVRRKWAWCWKPRPGTGPAPCWWPRLHPHTRVRTGPRPAGRARSTLPACSVAPEPRRTPRPAPEAVKWPPLCATIRAKGALTPPEGAIFQRRRVCWCRPRPPLSPRQPGASEEEEPDRKSH